MYNTGLELRNFELIVIRLNCFIKYVFFQKKTKSKGFNLNQVIVDLNLGPSLALSWYRFTGLVSELGRSFRFCFFIFGACFTQDLMTRFSNLV